MWESPGNQRRCCDTMVNRDFPKAVYITWAQTSSRSDSTAFFFNARSYRITGIKSRSKLLLPWKYLKASGRTLFLLFRDRPKVVFVQNPPVVAVLIVWLYARCFGAGFIPDSHCSVFNTRKWRRFLWLYRYFAKRALINIAHNHRYVEEVKAWGARAVNLGGVPRKMETGRTYQIRSGFNVVFPSSFERDEPIAEVVEAARSLSDVNFYITGNFHRAPKELVEAAPANVIFTGFLSDEDYVALLKACSAVMCLTTRGDTNQSGAYEAIALNRPIIVSDWSLLRQIYDKGAVFTRNDSASLVRAVSTVRDNHDFYLKDIMAMREKNQLSWEKSYRELSAAIHNGHTLRAH